MKSISPYKPLLVLVGIAILAAFALSLQFYDHLFFWSHFFMGFFFCQFAMLKLFNIKGFVEGFQKYDLVTQKFPSYAYLYPFIELALGLSFLSFFFPLTTYIATIAITLISAIGVISALRHGLNVQCACMGTVLNVPLSTVTLLEDIVMGIMACFMLFSSLL